ncbi:ATP-binding cassette domain-containing protein [Cellulomonas shaoxiangyii]|uniref:ATP-binding cassette domain-containing protein n=1 Tax=Cellulomonas shaoxiangyii TaxID=2566013 RepID=A0A4P7SM02_9CELL|nr:ATP-binding cassette domain-containing protein [Cellulomonas shaoxiangyii]QCB94991.1 ATP-binding cassette domain-containing protein [Cellulomonas shaoxiangyii]TGY85278.1 ATP-binding cassette domain-containing protein [Cellulomonas shaoxiangyii]
MTTSATLAPVRRPPGDGTPCSVLVEDLHRTLGGRDVLAGVDLAVRDGEVYGFLGPNGAGKTTLVRTLCTLLAPTSGRAVVAGFDVATRPGEVRLRIGAALQATALDLKQTGRELLRLQGRLYGMRAAQIDRRLRELGDLVALGSALDRPAGSYSGGMRRRLDVAMALVHSPGVVFLDEPTTGLDPESREALWAEVQHLNAELGVTVFLTTQYLEEADVLAHRVGIISAGRVVAEGTPDELKRTIGTDVVVAEVDEQAGDAADALRRLDVVEGVEVRGDQVTASVLDGTRALGPVAVALATAGVRTRSLALRRPTLDDVFLSLTGRHFATDDGAPHPDEAREATR